MPKLFSTRPVWREKSNNLKERRPFTFKVMPPRA